MSKIIWTADWHLVADKPRCRIDEDWLGFLDKIMQFIVKTANDKKAILGIGGDLFGRKSPNVPNYIVTMFLKNVLKVKLGTRILAGNHDQPGHNFDYIEKSSFGILDAFITGNENNGRLNYIDDLGSWSHFNGEVKNPNQELQFVHRLVFNNAKSIPPNVQASTAQELLDEYPNAKMILVGDNHGSFVYKKNGRYLINPGSIYRGNASQKEYKPSVYFIDTDKEIIEQIFLPDTDLMVEDEYLIEEEEKENHIGAFVEKLKKNEAIELDFMKNIEKALLINKKLSKETVSMINYLCSEKEE
jgi:DNA repair exonuclease SbcCD nuclease subunit